MAVVIEIVTAVSILNINVCGVGNRRIVVMSMIKGGSDNRSSDNNNCNKNR